MPKYQISKFQQRVECILGEWSAREGAEDKAASGFRIMSCVEPDADMVWYHTCDLVNDTVCVVFSLIYNSQTTGASGGFGQACARAVRSN